MFRITVFLTLFLFFAQKGSTQELTTFPGFLSYNYYQDSDKITRTEFFDLLSSDPESLVFLDKRKKQNTVVWISVGAYLGSAIWLGAVDNRSSVNDSNSDAIAPGILFLGSLVTGVVFSVKARNSLTKAILKYNDNLDAVTLDFRPTNNGLGLVLSF